MKLVASLIVRNEIGRYLEPCIDHLLEFCDEIRVLNDGSDDGTTDYLMSRVRDGIRPLNMDTSGFYTHEGKARQRLLDWTLESDPTHVLAIDADEFVTDGHAIRRVIEKPSRYGAWRLCMQEAWGADLDGLTIRQDGGWVEHDVPILWVVHGAAGPLGMSNRALACGRTPTAVAHMLKGDTCSAVLHFGWANETERVLRYQRYVDHDGGRFHRSAHLDSIMWGPDRVKTSRCAWPDGLLPYRDAILAHAGVNTPAA